MQTNRTHETKRPTATLLSRLGPPLKRTCEHTPFGSSLADQSTENPSLKQPRLERVGPNVQKLCRDTAGTSSETTVSEHLSKASSSRTRVHNGSPLSPGRSSRSPKPVRGRPDSRGKRPINERDKMAASPRSTLPEPLMDVQHIENLFEGDEGKDSSSDISSEWRVNPKSALSNFMVQAFGRLPQYETKDGLILGKKVFRTSVKINDDITGVGDAENRKDSEKCAALSANFQIRRHNLRAKRPDTPRESTTVSKQVTEAQLSDGTIVDFDRARQFMDYYCRKYNFGQPEVDFEHQRVRGGQVWDATMYVGGSRIGLGSGKTKKDAKIGCYLDVTQYLERCDRPLWDAFLIAAKTGKNIGLAQHVNFQLTERLEDDIQDLCSDMRHSTLYQNRPAIGSSITRSDVNADVVKVWRPTGEGVLRSRSGQLLRRRRAYLADAKFEVMRRQRQSLPVYSRADDILKHVSENEVTICMAETGSGKTTQIPQIILDDAIDKGDGARCNIFCTQPRRIAAISVAHRVAQERGEIVGRGNSIGYHVRFESKLPDEHGSITFCTIGVFLRRLQNTLLGGDRVLDNVTHIIVDEIHERDIDTDLLLVVLKRLLRDRRSKGKPLKVVLMSATIDPTIFQRYFPDDQGHLANVIEIPGRSFPVEKYYIDDFLPELISKPDTPRWAFCDDKVTKYLNRELGASVMSSLEKRFGIVEARGSPRPDGRPEWDEELEIPYPLVALTISHVLRKTTSGHVLVFLPGWDEIQSVQRILVDPMTSLGFDFSNRSKFELHVLHSTIPLAEQQKIFETPPDGVRRVILSTNIAETSVTIPDVVYVIDTGKIKENRYDPDRHISSLVSTWAGKSNIFQRAGRAGRHRPGSYYGLMSKDRLSKLHTHQSVEMKRMDLSNVVMHVKALAFSDMDVDEVLAATIEPPEPDRVLAAIDGLTMVGALDSQRNLTSLGRVLLQLPVDVHVGRLVLLGSFFKCLDQALTLAAILTNRDPFLSPPLLKSEAQAIKNSWSPAEYRSDALTVLRAYNAWWEMERRGDYAAATRFCSNNFLSKMTLLTISKIRNHLLQSVYDVGIIGISAGGSVERNLPRNHSIPPALNENGDSLPLLAALIASAEQPKFAVRTSPKSYRTAREKHTAVHPSSVNHHKNEAAETDTSDRQIVCFSEKRQNLSLVNQAPGPVYLVGCTQLDPMTYVLFGTRNLEASDRGFICDDWLPIVGNVDALDNIRQLKVLLEGCLLRVFEGVHMNSHRTNRNLVKVSRRARDIDEDESGDEDESTSEDMGLTSAEVKDLDNITHDLVRILDRYSEEHIRSLSRHGSRSGTRSSSRTKQGSPSLGSLRLPGASSGPRRSGTSTPYNMSYDSRPTTPSRLSIPMGHF